MNAALIEELKSILDGDVATDEEAKMWGAKLGKACGWPQEIRKFKVQALT